MIGQVTPSPKGIGPHDKRIFAPYPDHRVAIRQRLRVAFNPPASGNPHIFHRQRFFIKEPGLLVDKAVQVVQDVCPLLIHLQVAPRKGRPQA